MHLDDNAPIRKPEMIEWIRDRLKAIDPSKTPVNHIVHPFKLKEPGAPSAKMAPREM